jgi:hypothetical protein
MDRLLIDWHGIEGEVVSREILWHPILGPAVTALLLLVLVGSAAWLYREKGSGLSPRRKSLLFFLRCLALLFLFPMLVQLRVRLNTEEKISPLVAVAVDTSASMSLEDRYVTPEERSAVARAVGETDPGRAEAYLSGDRLARIDLVRAMLTSEQVGFATGLAGSVRPAWFRFASRAEPLAAAGWNLPAASAVEAVTRLPADAEYTDLAGGIDEIESVLRGHSLRSVVLLTDGAHNSGRPPAAAAEGWNRRGLKVYPVIVGASDPNDVEILQVIADRILFRDDPVKILVRLRSRGYDGRSVPVVLYRNEKEIVRVETELRRDEPETAVPLTFTPEQVGEFTFHVEVPVQTGEIVEDNNRRSFVARVTDEGINVLYIENIPRWQYRFLRNAMNRDRRVDLSVLLLSGEHTARPDPPELASLPDVKEDFFKYDVIVLGDVSPDSFTREQLEWIHELVSEEGAGFLALAGPFFNPWDYSETVLADLFPVEIEQTGERRRWPRREREDLFRVDLTPAGTAHPVMSLSGEWEANAPAWESLPQLYWFASVEKARPGATVLAVHPRAGSGENPVPIFAFQFFGRGGCFYAGVDETWRWRLKQGDRVFYRFWGQVIQFLGTPHLEGKERRLEIRTDREEYERGETAIVSVRGEALSVGPDDVFYAVAEDERGRRTRFALSRSPAAEGLLEGRFPLRNPGVYRIWLEGSELTASTVIRVTAPRVEFQNPAADYSLLGDIARITGGALVTPREFPRILDMIDTRPVSVKAERDVPLWDRPLWIILFCAALAGEWALRRLWQLP